MSSRGTKARRRSGHPARVAARQAPAPQKNRRQRTPKRLGRIRSSGARQCWLGLRVRVWAGLLGALRTRRQQPLLALLELTRADLVWAAATGVAAAGLFATVLTAHPGLGDAPETVAGVSSLGILHAPGYPAYVLTAHLFALIVPVGSEALRVNLFSLVCAATNVAGVQLLARRAGAPRGASTIAALLLAAGAGFWFYAGFAKHDMFSGLLLLITLHLALDLDRRATETRAPIALWRPAILGGAFGLGLGSSWPLMMLALPTVLLVLLRRATLRDPRRLAACAGAGLLAVVAVYGFVIVRAAENPPLNWGDATSISRLVDLGRRADFTGSAIAAARSRAAAKPAAVSGSAASSGSGLGTEFAGKVAGDFGFFHTEIGWIGLAIAAWGVTVAQWRRRRRVAPALALTFAVSLLGTGAIVGTASAGGYDVDLAEEGFLFGCYFPLACWVALGLGDLLGQLHARVDGRTKRGALVLTVLATGLGAAFVARSVGEHWTVAHRASRPLADRFAASVFAELPPRAVLFVWGAENTQPLVYRQVVFRARPDVTVIAVDGLSYDWYRAEVSRRLKLVLPPIVGNPIADARSVIHALLGGARPVYLDALAGQMLSAQSRAGAQAPGRPIGYLPVGILARAVAGKGVVPVASPSALATAVTTGERSGGVPASDWLVWPSVNLAGDIYGTAALEVARAYSERHDLRNMARWLRNVLAIVPTDPTAREDLAALSAIQSAADLRLIK